MSVFFGFSKIEIYKFPNVFELSWLNIYILTKYLQFLARKKNINKTLNRKKKTKYALICP